MQMEMEKEEFQLWSPEHHTHSDIWRWEHHNMAYTL